MFCKVVKLPNAVIQHQKEELLTELTSRVENTEHTVRDRKTLEKLIEKMTAEAIKTRIRRKKTVNELRNNYYLNKQF